MAGKFVRYILIFQTASRQLRYQIPPRRWLTSLAYWQGCRVQGQLRGKLLCTSMLESGFAKIASPGPQDIQCFFAGWAGSSASVYGAHTPFIGNQPILLRVGYWLNNILIGCTRQGVGVKAYYGRAQRVSNYEGVGKIHNRLLVPFEASRLYL